jgi:hypothetical protein
MNTHQNEGIFLMPQFTQNTNHPQNQIKYMHAAAKKRFHNRPGLQGIAQEFAKSALTIGKSLNRLTISLNEEGYSDPEAMVMVEKELFIHRNVADSYRQVSRTYQPIDQEEKRFDYFYLSTVPRKTLLAFIPHLEAYFQQPSQGIGPNVWMTKKSIEIHLRPENGEPQWVNLKFLTVEQVKNLPNLVVAPPPIVTQQSPGTGSTPPPSSNQQCSGTSQNISSPPDELDDIFGSLFGTEDLNADNVNADNYMFPNRNDSNPFIP